MKDGDLYYLVDRLARIEVADDAYNQYAYGDGNNLIRQDNLLLYLQQMAAIIPRTLLLAEAPGYRGCRLTGIPVMSRAVLADGIDPLGLFGQGRGYRMTCDPGFEDIRGEQSATILWHTLETLRARPIVWNTFPFHPHKPDNPRSNRKPRKRETEIGQRLLSDFLDIFPIEQIIAVGQVAATTLQRMGLDFISVRHPAQGGKKLFVTGITGVFHHVKES